VPRSVRSRFRKAILIVLGFVAGSALIEHALELGDAARLSAYSTFHSVHGRKVRYQLAGAGQPGPTIVLVCGAMASLEEWDSVQAALSADAPVVSYDRAGMGFSDYSEGYDAIAQAEELEGILRAPGISPPFVVVSYSGSASLARVFTATHRDSVKGLVFLDPTIPEAVRATQGRGVYLRKYTWALGKKMIGSFFGYLRLKQVIARTATAEPVHVNPWGQRHELALPQVLEREEALEVSFHYWLAITRDVFALDRSDEEAAATPWFDTIAVGVLSVVDPDASELDRAIVAGQRDMATKSTRGIFLAGAHVGHANILSDPVASPAAVDLIRTIRNLARGTQDATVSP
jgi:pimeloyl-ACP methyl ester carboxylesterase